MSSPRNSGYRTPDHVTNNGGSRTPSRNTPRAGNRTPSNVGTPRRRLIGTSERDVIPPSDGSMTPRRSQAPSSPFHGGISEIDLSSPINYGTPSSIGSMRSTRSGIRGTPVRMRPDIGADRRARVVLLGDNQTATDNDLPSQHSDADSTPNLVIWGTNVVVSKCKQKFKRFIEEFVDPNPAEDEISDEIDLTLPLYLQKLQEVNILERPFLNLNCSHLEDFDPEFYQQLINYPQEVIPTLDMAANEMFFEKYPAAVLEHQIQVRPFNSRRTKSMRELNPEDIDQLITVNGMVIRVSNIIPEIREAFFKCIVCSYVTTVAIEKGYVSEPTLCPSCSTNHCFQLIHNRSHFTDKQIIKLQESPDDIPAGQTPHTVTLLCYSDMVDSVHAGERVTVTGIFRAVPIQVNPRMSNVLSVYRTYIDCVHFRKVDVNRLHVVEEGQEHKFPPERVELLRTLSKKDDIYERLASALAPSIYGNLDVKKGILLQLFGGKRKRDDKTSRNKKRSEINILLCGDPGTSKSQLLSYVYDLVPRSQYTSGKGSSAVGLTAYVMKDPETKQLVLQTGALVLADNGVCCIDEFDKMNDSTRSVLHEVMEQQTLSIAKAGIICQLNARTSILAAANPCESQWNMKKTIIENILLPHSLLSRFDLIFLMLDPQDESYDKRLAYHLVSLYHKQRENDEIDHMDMDIMKDYIAYARENINPVITEGARRELREAYVKMRHIGSGRGQISAYPRQLESLIRLAEAHARMRFSDSVEISDVKEAQRLYTEALKQSATDPNTGVVDVTIIGTGHSESYRNEIKNVSNLLKSIIKKKNKDSIITYQQLYNELKEAYQKVVEYNIFDQCLRELEDERLVTVTPRTSIKIR